MPNAYSLVRAHRSSIMGFAMLWVVLFHSGIVLDNPVFTVLKDTGYGGVDLFLLLSGFGVAHSLTVNSIPMFIKNRLISILPSYYLFLTIYIIFSFVILNGMTITEVAGNITLAGWWIGIGNQFNWFICAIIMFYIISPAIFTAFVRTSKPLVALLVVVAFLILVSCIAFKSELLIAASRLPIFAIGIFGGIHLNRLNIDNRMLISLSSVGVVFGFGILVLLIKYQGQYLWPYGLWWYPFILIGPCLTVLLAVATEIATTFRMTRVLAKGLAFIGRASLEIYLVHIPVFRHIDELVPMGNARWLLAGVCCVAAGLLAHVAVARAGKAVAVVWGKRAGIAVESGGRAKPGRPLK